jgi:hypothetical protein
MPRFHKKLSLLLAIQLCAGLALAQWTNQSFILHPGWNSVFLEIQPEPKDCDTLFAGLPIESVWGWNGHFSTVQYIQDPNSLIPGQPLWLVHLPPSGTNANRVVNSLFNLLGERAYLIRVATNAPTFTWTIRGRPTPRGVSWVPDSYNLTGFHVDPVQPPTFQSYFSASLAQSGGPMFRLDSTGVWVAVSPSTDHISEGLAYWIKSSGPSTYPGPISLVFQQGHGIDFSRSLQEQVLTIQNNSTTARTVTLAKLASGTPQSSGAYPPLAGDVPLSYWKSMFPTNLGFVRLTGPISNTIAAGGSWSIRLAVRRPDMAPSTDPTAQYQSLLQVSDGAGSRWLVPVTAYGFHAFVRASSSAASRAVRNSGVTRTKSPTESPYAGFWVGTAVIDHVSQPASPTNSTFPLPAASQFQLRLLLHLDASGQARLLPHALLMWTNGTYFTNSAGIQEVDQPGRYVVVTDDSLIPYFSGASVLGGQLVGKRFSTTAFALSGPALLSSSADFGANNSIFSYTNVLSYTNTLNPFVHPYHPDHDNWDDFHTTVLPEGTESFTIIRQIALQFTSQDPNNLTMPGWGDNQLGGIYSEAITGLHNSTLHVQGTFRIQQACRIDVLNDGIQ